MKLNTIKEDGWNKTRWCGPTALAIITGRTLKFCHNKLARLEKKEPRYLKGVQWFNMTRSLQAMGFKCERVASAESMTLRQYIEEVQTSKHFRDIMLVYVTSHYVVIHRGMVVDNHVTAPLPVREHPAWRTHIKLAWFVKK